MEISTAVKDRFLKAMGTLASTHTNAAIVLKWLEDKGSIKAQLCVTANDEANTFIFITQGFEKFCILCGIDEGQVVVTDMNGSYTKKEVTAFGMRVFALEEKEVSD